MNFDRFVEALEAGRRRIALLTRRIPNLDLDQNSQLLTEVFEDLDNALEELQVSQEELAATSLSLAAERQRYQELFEFAPDGYLVTDPAGVIQEANRTAAALLKVSQQALIGKPLFVYVTRQAQETFYQLLNQLNQLAQTDLDQTWEFSLQPRDDQPIEAALSVASVRDTNGQVVALRWLLRDVSQRKRADETLQKLAADLEHRVQERTTQLQQALALEAAFKNVTDKLRDSLDEGQILKTAVQELVRVLQVDHCDMGLYDLDQRRSVICCECLATTPSLAQDREVCMADFPELYRPLLQCQPLYFCGLISGERRSQPVILACPIFDDQGILGDLWLSKSKDHLFNELEIRLVQQVANQCAIAIRQARLYQAAQAQVKELAHLNQLKDDFLSTVSHELRTPMTNMTMAIKMLKVTVNQLTLNQPQVPLEPVLRYLQILDDECGREARLIDDLLDLNRLEAVEQSLEPETLELRSWLPRIVQPFQERVESAQQSLSLDLAAALPPFPCHASSLARILTELLNNACKYTPAGEQISLAVAADADTVRLSVSNSGVEIPAHELPLIFDKFYRVPSADPWKRGGTGLGLALSQKLTAHLGGVIQVESASNLTRFTVVLPLRPTQPPITTSSPSPDAPESASKLHS